MSHLCRRAVLFAAVIFSTVGLASPAVAEDYPSRPLTLVVPFPPGGNSDILGRLLAEKIGQDMGQTVVVENRTGAGGLIGNGAVARAAPDGYTLLLGGMSTQILLSGTVSQFPYDPAPGKSLEAAALISAVPLVLVVPADSPAPDLPSFVSFLKASPGAYNYSSAGSGTSGHITAQYFADAVGADVVHVPYRGSALALNDLVSGRNAYLVDTPPVIAGFVKSGKLRALATFTDKRLAELPDVPTVAESGLGEVLTQTMAPWQALFVPAGTPDTIKQRLNTAVQHALADPAFVARLTSMGFIPRGGSMLDAQRLYQDDYDKWLPILRGMRIAPQETTQAAPATSAQSKL